MEPEGQEMGGSHLSVKKRGWSGRDGVTGTCLCLGTACVSDCAIESWQWYKKKVGLCLLKGEEATLERCMSAVNTEGTVQFCVP